MIDNGQRECACVHAGAGRGGGGARGGVRGGGGGGRVPVKKYSSIEVKLKT